MGSFYTYTAVAFYSLSRIGARLAERKILTHLAHESRPKSGRKIVKTFGYNDRTLSLTESPEQRVFLNINVHRQRQVRGTISVDAARPEIQLCSETSCQGGDLSDSYKQQRYFMDRSMLYG